MSHKPNGDAVWQALNLAFYALTEELEQAGVLDQDKLADQILRYQDENNPVLMANLNGLAETLRTRPFGPFRLGVIDGGKDE